MQHLKLISFVFFIALFFSAFIGVDSENAMNTPGTIEVIGDAGSPQVFTFEKWQFTEVSMLDGNPENIQAKIEINISSLSTAWKDLEKNVKKKKDYFCVKKFPKAYIVIQGAKKLEDGRYETIAQLSLKKYTKPVTLNFTISETAPYVVEGEGVIQRSQFGFSGNGPKEEVPVKFKASLPLSE